MSVQLPQPQMDPNQGQPTQGTEVQTQQVVQAEPTQDQVDYYNQFQPAQSQPQQPAQPQPIAGTSFYTQDQLAEGYKNLQRMTEQRQQQLTDIQQRYDQVVQHALTLQKQATQQPVQQNREVMPWELPVEQFTDAFNTNPTGVLSKLRDSVQSSVEAKAQEMFAPMQQQLQATQMILNRQAVTNTYNELSTLYGQIPNYENLLNTAVEQITSNPVWVQAANENPAQALRTAFEAELGKNLSNPEFIATFGKNMAQQHQQNVAQRQFAQPMTTSSNVQTLPHQPITNNGQSPINQNAQLAHQIATYNNQEYYNPQRQYQVQMNDI